MSIAEVKNEISRMTLTERAEVQRHLRALRWLEDPEMPARIDAAMARMDAGEKVTAEELRRRLVERFGADFV